MEWSELPVEIQERMLEEQVAQGNPRDSSIFEKRLTSDQYGKGFSWGISKEDHDFWDSIISYGNIQKFFDKYPKKGETINTNNNLSNTEIKNNNMLKERKIFHTFTYLERQITLAILATPTTNLSYAITAGYSVCAPEDMFDQGLAKVISTGRAKYGKSVIHCGVVSSNLITDFKILKSIAESLQYKIENGITVIKGIK